MRVGVRNIIVALMVLAAAQSARAQEGGGSRANRANKSIMIALQPIGFGPIPSLTNALIVGYFLEPDLVLQLEVANGFRINYTAVEAGKDENGSGTSSSSTGWEVEYKANSAGLYAKYFVGNSFYVKGGVDYRNVVQKDIYYTTLSQRAYEFNGNALALAFAFGNQFQFSYFTLGFDIAGYVVPVSNSVTETFPAGATAYGERRSRDAQDAYLKQPSAILGRFYLGASF